MRRRVLLLACFLVVPGGLHARDTTVPGWFDLSVPGGAETLAAMGIDEQDRALTLPLLARALHERDTILGRRIAEAVRTIDLSSAPAGAALTIPAPLEPGLWWQLLPPPRSGDLFVRLLGDRNGLLLASGLIGTDASVRAWLSRERDLLRVAYAHAPSFVMISRRLRYAGGSIDAPGGAAAEGIWQALAGASPRRAEPFLRALLTKDQGRLAWYYGTIAALDEGRRGAAWGTPPSAERAAALYDTFRTSDGQWNATAQPFRRNLHDASTVVTHTQVAGDAVEGPLPQAALALLFSGSRAGADQIEAALRDRSAVSLPWLTRQIVSAAPRERRTRFEMMRLAQRVFAGRPPAEARDVALALAGFRDFRALLFALERMEVRSARVWADAVAAARHVSRQASDAPHAVVAFQGSLALLERMRHAGALDAPAAERLIASLSDAVRTDRRVTVSVARWLAGSLAPTLSRLVQPADEDGGPSLEEMVLQALGGTAEGGSGSVEWEGLSYVLDPVGTERERLRDVRAQLVLPTLDEALQAGRPRELASALTALVYATALGESDGPVTLSPDVAARHEFGFSGTSIIREMLPWAPPEERHGVGPWHVQGALLGLDLALSRLALRRIDTQQIPPAPTLTLNDFGTLTRTLVLMRPAALTDAARDEIAAAIARGRARVDAVGDAPQAEGLAAECAMSATSRQLLPWVMARVPATLPRMFSMRALLCLGQPRVSDAELDAWGVAADGLDGRWRTAMPPAADWEDHAGRSQAGHVTTQVPDLTLRLVEETARLRLPASLVPAMLAFAADDYWHEVQARFADDWPELTARAAALTPERVHDYAAALAGGGPLRTP